MSEERERLAVVESDLERIHDDITKLTEKTMLIDKAVNRLDRTYVETAIRIENKLENLNKVVVERMVSMRNIKVWVAGLVGTVLAAVIVAYVLVNIGLKG